ncbi:uncharacterized protein [Physcomitrium patens]|uniref:Uncharacterized protein n=1 Tax=Physcomitrium patens TaxID=3218 RepID=A0A2K1JLP7_PHYPA|nr:uncharacterized protein LOC112290419 [Physcomitrium patens]PNR42296.1 hypothetical protein PHYPA_017125 [Physcomitrium patens]|eukprot:XP_024392384.1 uncharacterized protein LOC112290419 [Physcomitrella patens]
MAMAMAQPIAVVSTSFFTPRPFTSSPAAASPLQIRLCPTPRRLPLCRAQTKAMAPITFHIGETSLSIPFSLDSAKGLSAAIADLLTTFREKEKAERPRRWDNMEYRQIEDGVFFEVFCNPNAHATAFQAKYLVTINDDKLRIASEGQLSALKSDLDQYIDSQS